MFYGGVGRDDAGRGGNRNPNRNDRYEQMTKQQQLIENKKQEIQKRLEEERHRKTMEALLMDSAKSSSTALGSSSSSATSSPAPASSRQKSSHTIKSEDGSTANALPFANDGSFLENFRKMQEEKKKEKEKEVKIKAEVKEELNEYGSPYGSAPRPPPPPPPPSLKIIDPNSMNQNTNQGGQGGGMYNNNNNNSGGPRNYPHQNYYGNAPPPPAPHPGPPHNRGTPPPMQHQQYMGFGYGQNAPPPPPPPPPPQHPSRPKSQQYQSPPPQSYSHPPPQNYSQAPPPPPQQRPSSGFPSEKVKQLAAKVAESGDVVEHMARINNKDDPIFWFLYRPDSAEYGRYRDLVTHLKFENMPPSPPPPPPPPPPQLKPLFPPGEMPTEELSPPPQTIKRPAPDDEDEAGKKRRSRWGPQSGAAVPPPTMAAFSQIKEEDNSLHPSLMGANSERPPAPPPSLPLSVAYPIGGIKQESGLSQSNFGGAGNDGGVLQIPPPGVNFSPNVNINLKGPPPMLTRVTRTNPQLLAYAKQSYGTVDLDDEQWKQCEEAYKMNLLFQDIARKKAKDEQMAMAGKFKHEYDSDEEVDDGGTWEHKQRMKEMEKTRDWAQELTQRNKGKHHIGDFLPPEELEKFMDKYKAVKEGRQMDESAYQDFKIAQDNVGFKLLQKMGWNDGQGLGSSGQGITAPIDKGAVVSDKQGLGVEKPSELNEEDDEYAAYRKRMMLAYRFRPNPLNNPRRAYY